jgi:hypothetical protein
MLIIAALGLWLGLAATYYSVERGHDLGFGTGLVFGAVKAGPWSGWPKTGTREADPYARALFARNGETPLGVTEGLGFIARSDSDGCWHTYKHERHNGLDWNQHLHWCNQC